MVCWCKVVKYINQLTRVLVQDQKGQFTQKWQDRERKAQKAVPANSRNPHEPIALVSMNQDPLSLSRSA
jgi:hypothetical protein